LPFSSNNTEGYEIGLQQGREDLKTQLKPVAYYRYTLARHKSTEWWEDFQLGYTEAVNEKLNLNDSRPNPATISQGEIHNRGYQWGLKFPKASGAEIEEELDRIGILYKIHYITFYDMYFDEFVEGWQEGSVAALGFTPECEEFPYGFDEKHRNNPPMVDHPRQLENPSRPNPAAIIKDIDNPRLKKAKNIYEDFWLGKEPTKVSSRKISLPGKNEPLIYLGDLAGIIYASDKEDTTQGAEQLYFHDIVPDPAYPKIYSTEDKKTIIIPLNGSGMRIADGWFREKHE